MAMVVNHNLSAANTLVTLNRNVGALSGDLARLASGQRINGAGDNAAAYAVSERMRVQLRSLNQDIINVKTGRNLCSVAAGAVDSIVSELRCMKALALNSVNDTNTDADRATMQKEYVQRRNQIDDIAATTDYNGKILLDGRYRHGVIKAMGPGAKYKSGCRIPDSTYTDGMVPDPDGALDDITGRNHVNLQGEAYVTVDPGTRPTGPGPNGEDNDYSDMKLPLDGSIMPVDLGGKGITVVCEECKQDVAIMFSTDMSIGDKAIKYEDADNDGAMAYLVGADGAADENDVIRAIYEGVAALNSETVDPMTGEPCVMLADRHDLRITKTAGGEYHLRKNGPRMFLLDGFEGEFEKGYEAPLIIHHGTKSSQNLRLYFDDMGCAALGIGRASIDTQEHALAMLSTLNADGSTTTGPIDKALSRALDMATTIGAYCQRLDAIEGTLTVNHENTTASESTIRDADMARTMTEYAKHSVLSQSAQAMLAQANQNSSSVLSLLQ